MKAIVYDGTADFQEFSSADFKKADVDQDKLVFPRGKAVAVEDGVADALLSKDGIFGDHKFREPKKGDEGFDDLDEALSQAEAKASKKSGSTKEVPDNEGAALQESTGTPPPSAGAAGTTTTAATGTTTPST